MKYIYLPAYLSLNEINNHEAVVKFYLRNNSFSFYKLFKDKNEDISYDEIIKSRQAKVSRMILNNLYTIKSPLPNIFFTISIPNKDYAYVGTNDIFKHYRVFRNIIKNEYKDSWFLYKYEFDLKRLFHMHLVSYMPFDKIDKSVLTHISKKFENIFYEASFCSADEIVQAVRYNQNYHGVSLSKYDSFEDYECIRLIDRYCHGDTIKIAGFINKTLIKFMSYEIYTLSLDKFNLFCNKIGKYNIIKKKNLRDSLRVLANCFGTIADINRDAFVNLINRIA